MVFLCPIFTPLEIMPRCSAAGLHFRIIPAGFNAPLEFLTGFTPKSEHPVKLHPPSFQTQRSVKDIAKDTF